MYVLCVGQVERLKVIFNEATSALTDDVSEVSQFCVSLECCLRHHQKGGEQQFIDMTTSVFTFSVALVVQRR